MAYIPAADGTISMPVQVVTTSGSTVSQIQLFDGTNWQNWQNLPSVSGTAATNAPGVALLLRNGTNYLPAMDANAANGNPGGNGLLGVGLFGWGSSTWQRLATQNSLADGAAPGQASQWLPQSIMSYNGFSFDRLRSHQLAAGSGSVASPTGILFASTANSYLNLAGSGTVGIKAGPGILHSVTINTKTLTAGANLKLYDNTAVLAANLIATIDVSSAATGSPGFLLFDVRFATGLVAVLSQNGADITINYI